MGWIEDGCRILDISDQKVRVLDDGQGAPVVVLHGWGGRIESMAPVLNCLRGRFRLIALDLPGFGESPVPSQVWGTPEYAGLVAGALVALEVDKAHFVGHSYGAKTSLYLAATQPDKVDRLVLQGSSGLRAPPSMKARLKRVVSKAARFAGKLGAPGRAVRQAIYDRIASQDYKDAGPLRPILVKVVNEDMTPFLTQIRASTLLVWGTEDDAAPPAHGKTMAKLIPDAGLIEFEGAGHFAYLEQPERFCTIVRHFLEGAG